VTGTTHGSVVEGPDGHRWRFYTIVLSNPPGGRRIGMDPVASDEEGNMSVRVTDTPQWAPGVVANPARDGDSGSISVSINKVRAMNAKSRFSSQQAGPDAAHAVDNSSGTWWEPSPDDAQPTLTLDLGPATRFDIVQLVTIDSVRLLFTGGRRFGGPRAPAAAASAEAATTSTSALPSTDAHQYRIDVPTDVDTHTTVLDQSANTVARSTIFEELPPTRCRFVRLTMTNWPRVTPLGIIEFTVFGKAAGSLPAEQPIPGRH
jgi:xylan 1,4-beta-xylosidase